MMTEPNEFYAMDLRDMESHYPYSFRRLRAEKEAAVLEATRKEITRGRKLCTDIVDLAEKQARIGVYAKVLGWLNDYENGVDGVQKPCLPWIKNRIQKAVDEAKKK